MPRMIVTLFAAAIASGAAASASTAYAAQDDDEDCTVIRYLPNGRRIIKPALRQPGVDAAGVRRSYAAASGDGSASSVSVSSSSRGAGHASASASSSSNGRNGRTVTTTHDDNGCTIVINEGRRRGAKR